MLTWKIVGVSKVSVLYIYIDNKREESAGREEHTFCGYGGFWLRNFCFWWKKWCVFGWKVGFAVGLRKEHWKRKVYRVLWDWGRSVGEKSLSGFQKLYFDFKFFFLILCWRGKLWEFQKFRFYIYIDKWIFYNFWSRHGPQAWLYFNN